MRVGIFGRGPWSDKIVETLKRDFPDVEIAWRKGRNWREDFVAGWKFDDDGVIRGHGIGAVIIASAAPTHADLAALFLRAGIPCFIEKPMAMNPTEARKVAAPYKNLLHRVVVNHVPLYSQAYRAMRTALIGMRIESAEVTYIGNGPYRPDANALWDYGPHAAAVAIDLIGDPPWHIVRGLAGEPEDDAKSGAVHAVTVSPARVKRPEVKMVFGNGAREKKRRIEVRAGWGAGWKVYAVDLLTDEFTIDGESQGTLPLARPGTEGIRVRPLPPLTFALQRFFDGECFRDLALSVHVTDLLHSIEGTVGFEQTVGDPRR